MRYFVTGATGFIGSAVVQELLLHDHEVLGLARSDEAAEALAAVGATPHRGSLEDLDSLRRGAEAADGVAHLAFIHDFSNIARSGVVDLAAIEALGDTLAGTGKPFAVTSGTAMLTPGRVATEDDLSDPDGAGSHRARSDAAALGLADRGVRAVLVRFPPSVHGAGDHGFVPAVIGAAREAGVSTYVGDGTNRWAAVHRLDAARLYRLALESAPAGARLHAVGDEGVPFREIATVIGRHLGVPVESVTAADAQARLGFIGAFAGLDVPASAARTRELLGWEPVEQGLIADLEEGHYFTPVAA
jgi:nucleoside-diphosphate-sugar epimerase